MSKSMRVEVDQTRCASSGRCAWYAAGVFDQDAKNGIVQLLIPEPTPDQHEAVRDAVANCPTKSITILNDPDHS